MCFYSLFYLSFLFQLWFPLAIRNCEVYNYCHMNTKRSNIRMNRVFFYVFFCFLRTNFLNDKRYEIDRKVFEFYSVFAVFILKTHVYRRLHRVILCLSFTLSIVNFMPNGQTQSGRRIRKNDYDGSFGVYSVYYVANKDKYIYKALFFVHDASLALLDTDTYSLNKCFILSVIFRICWVFWIYQKQKQTCLKYIQIFFSLFRFYFFASYRIFLHS